jgi:hypothetical protein
MHLSEWIDAVCTAIDVTGVAVIVLVVFVAIAVFFFRLRGGSLFPDAYRAVRQTRGEGSCWVWSCSLRLTSSAPWPFNRR